MLTEWAPFVVRRLLTTDSVDGAAVVEVAHEAFLSAWPPLAAVITDNATALRARRRIEQAAAEWAADERRVNRLWTGDPLAAARADTGARLAKAVRNDATGDERTDTSSWLPRRHRGLVTDRVALSTASRAFLEASIRRDLFLRWRLTAGLAALLTIALAAGGIAVVQLGVAEQQRQVAVQQQRRVTAQYLLGQARSAIGTSPRVALQFAEAAHRLDPTPETGDGLVQLLDGTPYSGSPTDHTDAVTSVAFAPDGRTFASGSSDQSIILGTSGTPPAAADGPPLTGRTAAVYSLAFTPDGHTLAAGDARGSVVLRDVRDPAEPRPLGQPLTGQPIV